MDFDKNLDDFLAEINGVVKDDYDVDLSALEDIDLGDNISNSKNEDFVIEEDIILADTKSRKELIEFLDKAVLDINTKIEFNRKLRELRKDNIAKLEEAINTFEELQNKKTEILLLNEILKRYKSTKFSELKLNIENLINSTLTLLLEDALRIKLLETETRGTPGLDLVFIDSEDNVLDPDICIGNSIRQITALLYSLAVVGYSSKSKVFILDEVFTGLGEKYSRLMSQILSELAQNGYQIIMVQHNEYLFTDPYCRLMYASKNEEDCFTLQEVNKNKDNSSNS